MAKEETGKVVEGVEEKETPPELTQEGDDAAQSRIKELEADNQAKDEEIKKHYTKLNQKDLELKKRGDVETRLAELENRTVVQTDMLVDLVNRGVDFEEPKPTERPSDKYTSRLGKSKSEGQTPENEEAKTAMWEADSLARGIGLDMATADELDKAYLFFRTGDFSRGLKETKRVVNSKKAEAEKGKETEEETQKRIEHDVLVKHGLLKDGTGSPSGGNKNDQRILEDYQRDPKNPQHSKAYQDLRDRRGIN